MSDSGLAQSAGNLECGELVVGAATVRLRATKHKCLSVWVGAPTVNHTVGAANDGNILIGGANGQVMTLSKDNIAGITLLVEDASKIYFKGFNAGDVVEYCIFD